MNIRNNPSLARIYTRYYITEVIKQGGFNKKQLKDTAEESYLGEYVDEHDISLTPDGPFWPSGIAPYSSLPDTIARMDSKFIEKFKFDYKLGKNILSKNKLLNLSAKELKLKSSQINGFEPYQSTTAEKMEKLAYFNKPEASFHKELTLGHEGSKDYEYLKSGRYYVYDTDKVEYGLVHNSANPGCLVNSDQNIISDHKSQIIATDDNLIFDSMFESGNLRSARRVGTRAYELVMNTDRYTHRHTQWFFFSISNLKYKNYKFFLINMHKRDSLYNYGMQPVVFMNGKWQRFGTAIKYCPYYPA